MKKAIKLLLFLTLIGAGLEAGGYTYGLQPSIFIKSTFTNSNLKENLLQKYSFKILFNDLKENKLSQIKKSSEKNEIDLHGLNYNIEKYIALKSLSEATSKYPEKLINKNIDFIYLLKAIDYYGINVGGIYNYEKKSIFISTKYKKYNTNKSKHTIASIFHHEFSSILIKKYELSENDWINSSGKDFLYKSDEDPFYYTIYIQGNSEKIKNKDLYKRGLIKHYAETGVENDFNTYAEVIFTNPKKMKKLISQYPVIKRKYEVFKSFYMSIDEGFAP
ncbi:MAG: hypothetical protein ACRBCI_16220, partial [Cellvibrionaceae bacterium]